MAESPSRPRRRSIRLRGYDYTTPGAYFVTICTHRHVPLFGRVVDGNMRLNAFGRIVRDEWFRTAQVRPDVELLEHEFVVMPNHVHGIVWIALPDDRKTAGCASGEGHPPGRSGAAPAVFSGDPSGRPYRPRGPASDSLGAIIGQFKSAVSRRINALRNTPGAAVWQRNYHEHIIRTERALQAIRRYIAENPLRWHLDRYNPQAQGDDPEARRLWRMLKEDAARRPQP